MKKIRKNTFETNSSSVHSLIICTDEEYEKLNNDELYIDEFGEFVTSEECKKALIDFYLENNDVEEEVTNYDDFYNKYKFELNEFKEENKWELPCTLDEWIGDLETDTYYYVSKSGDNITIVTKFGYGG